MKNIIITGLLCLGLSVMPTNKTNAIAWVVIQEALKKVIKAMDLQVQRLQNKTIWLQNAQKTVENTMSKLQLDAISDWVYKNKEQYAKYFEELQQVKGAISGFKKVREIIGKQVQLVNEYKSAFSKFKQDKNFTLHETDYILKVYDGIIDQSLKNIDQLFLVINSLKTTMTDGTRLEIINHVSLSIDQNLNDLRNFNSQNAKLSLQRSMDVNELHHMKTILGIK